ncbi:MAG: GtrA family protein [Bilifractor sp.]|jgi:putative flippase GtrA
MKKLIKQLFRFGIVGVTAFAIDYALLYIFTEWVGLYYLLSSFLSYAISTVFNYLASVHWVFTVNEEHSQFRNFIIFITFSVIGLGINQLIMWFGVDRLGFNYMLVKLGATAIVMVYNFITRKIFLEK